MRRLGRLLGVQAPRAKKIPVGDWVVFPEIGQMMAQAFQAPPGVRAAGLAARCAGDGIEMVFHLDAMRAVVDPEGLCFVMFTMDYDVDWTIKKFAMPMDANVWAFDDEFPVYLLAHFAKAKPDAHHIFFFSLVNSEHEMTFPPKSGPLELEFSTFSFNEGGRLLKRKRCSEG